MGENQYLAVYTSSTMNRLLLLTLCGLSLCFSNRAIANIEFLEKLDCAFGMDYDDPNLLAYLDQQDVEFRSDYFTHKNYHSFTHPSGILVKLYTAENKKKFSSIELYFNNSEVSHSANSWLSEFGISQSIKETTKKYRGDMSYIGEEPYYKDGYNESQVVVIRSGNVWYTVRWNTEHKKAHWVREFHIRSQVPVNSTSSFPELSRRAFSHETFQPDQSNSYFTMLNRNFSKEDVDYMKRYFRWALQEDILRAPDGSYFKLKPQGDAMQAYAFYFTSLTSVPDVWSTYFTTQKILLEEQGLCGHGEAHLANVILYNGDQDCFRLQGYSDENAEITQYSIEISNDAFRFTPTTSYGMLKPRLGCTHSSDNCEQGSGEFHFGDGCYFKGIFKNGALHDGVVLYKEGQPARYINKEKELAQ